jgi:ferrous iron transport protein A
MTLHSPSTTLDALADGRNCVIDSVGAGSDVAKSSVLRRLLELGFVPGEHIRILRRGARGGPLAVKVGQSTFALRLFEAALVCVSPVGETA